MRRGWIVVTGAAGFIGSGVVRYLNDQGIDQLLLVDDLKTGNKWKNLVGKSFGDLISKHALFDWLKEKIEEVDAILHLGACSDTTEQNGDYLLQNNFHYTKKVAEIALKHGKRFIYASSAATYGDGSLGFSDTKKEIEELRPMNLYGWSKQLFDVWAKREGVLNQIVGLKYFNVFGPNEFHKGRMASLIYNTFSKVQQEGVIRLFKSDDPRFAHGEQKRDFIYIKDAVRMTCEFLNNQIGGIFNIGQGSAPTWNQLAGALFHALGKPEQIEYIEMPPSLSGQYQNYTCADMTKYCSAYGFPSQAEIIQYSMKDAVCDYVQNYLMQDRRW
jgi:ADP-L-glycero-D-manno-heptose 6-epimerase